jgi:hypothetical protein
LPLLAAKRVMVKRLAVMRKAAKDNDHEVRDGMPMGLHKK